MKKITTLAFIAVLATGFSGMANAANKAAEANYKLAKQNAEAQYTVAREKCDSLNGNPKDVCVAQAKADQKIANAHAKAEYKGTNKASKDARIDIADAEYDVAKTKCDSQNGNEKDVCIKAAKATHTTAKTNAKTTAKVAEVRHDANVEKNEANYKVALEKCDSFSGAAKDQCVATAKSHFGMK